MKFVCVVGILVSMSVYGNAVHLGFQSFFIGDSDQEVLKKVYRYNILYSQNSFVDEKAPLDLYLLLSRFQYAYNEHSMIPLKVGKETYYIRLDDFVLNTPEYRIVPIQGLHSLFYHSLTRLSLEKQHVHRVNPYLTHLDFHFFNKNLYKIHYELSTDLKKVRRLVDNFIARYGKPQTLKKTSKASKKKMTFHFIHKGLSIHLTMSMQLYYNLTKVDLIPSHSKEFITQHVKVQIFSQKQHAAVEQYKSNTMHNILTELQHSIRARHQQLLDIAQTTNTKHSDSEDYSSIDQL